MLDFGRQSLDMPKFGLESLEMPKIFRKSLDMSLEPRPGRQSKLCSNVIQKNFFLLFLNFFAFLLEWYIFLKLILHLQSRRGHVPHDHFAVWLWHIPPTGEADGKLRDRAGGHCRHPPRCLRLLHDHRQTQRPAGHHCHYPITSICKCPRATPHSSPQLELNTSSPLWVVSFSYVDNNWFYWHCAQ